MLPLPAGLAAEAPRDARAELVAMLRLAAPLVAANLLQMGVYSIDVIFVARLGTTELAAATLGVYVYGVMLFALIGLVGAASPLIAAELGRRAHAVREVRRSFRMAMWLAVGLGALCMLLLANGERFLLFAHQGPHVAERTGAFLDILLWATIPALATGAMRVTASALGRPGWAMIVTGLGLCTGLLGNWLLVFGHAGFPALGLEGSAIASVATSTAMAVAFAIILVTDRHLRRYRLFGRWWRIERSRMAEIVRLGVPIALTMTFEGALFSAAGFLMGLIGVTEVAAHAIALQIAAIAFQVPFGVAQAATIRVGLAYGAGDHRWAARAGWCALVVGTGFMAFTALLLVLMPRLFVGIYVDPDAAVNAALVPLAIQYLGVAAAFQLFDGAQAVAAGVLRGLQDTRVPMLIALLGYWVVGAGLAVALGFGLRWEGLGIWWGLAAGLAAVAGLLVWRWTARERLGLMPRRTLASA